jgi:hypothetical protein
MSNLTLTGQLVKNIQEGNVLIAEAGGAGNGQSAIGNGGSPSNCQLPVANYPTPVGYCIHKLLNAA